MTSQERINHLIDPGACDVCVCVCWGGGGGVNGGRGWRGVLGVGEGAAMLAGTCGLC
jgi:hypothetical protein